MAKKPTQSEQVTLSDESLTIDPDPIVTAAVAAEQQRCIDLVALVAMRVEVFAKRVHLVDAADAVVWLIENGYTPADAPTFEEREQIEKKRAMLKVELEPDPLDS